MLVGLKTLFITVFTLFLFTACGGEVVFFGENSSTGDTNQTDQNSSSDSNQTGIQRAYFIDAAVEGLEYETASHKGITDRVGSFYFDSTDTMITFSIGTIKIADFELKNLAKDSRLLPIDLIQNSTSIIRSSAINNKILKIILTLQSLDIDLDSSNGITITEGERNLFTESIDILDENLSISELNSTFINHGRKLIGVTRATNSYLATVNEINLLNQDVTPPLFKNGDSVMIKENQLDVIEIAIEDKSNVTLELDSDLFEWSPNSTLVKFKTAPDFETQSSYSFRVYATDEFNNSSFQDIIVTIENVDDTPPQFSNAGSVNVLEGTKAVVILNATDSESVNIRYELEPSSSAIFNLDGSIVSFKNTPDYEEQSSYNLLVRAIDESGNSALKSIVVNIIDVDEVAPIFLNESNLSVAENQLNVVTLQVEDSSDVTYKLEGADAAEFSVDGSKVSFQSAPDFEAGISYDFNITATDARSNSAKKAFHVTIVDVDENTPVITNEVNISINENSNYVMKIVAEDESALSYSVSGADANLFQYDALSGDVYLKVAADYETKSIYYFTIVATDSALNSGTKAITLHIKDLDDTGPLFSNESSVSVEENASFIMKVVASDVAGVSYSLATTSDSKTIHIDASSGEMSFTVLADYEIKSLYKVEVVATDGLGNESRQLITINISNIDDTAPTYTGSTLLQFEENSIASFYLQATDQDNIGALTYTLSGSEALSFDINSSTGKVSFKEKPDFEIKPRYLLDTVVSDAAGHTTTQTLTINIIDIDEIAPIFTTANSLSVDENQLGVTTITTRDVSEVKYYISGGADRASFTLEEKSGILTFKEAPDYEQKSSYTVRIEAVDAEQNSAELDLNIAINNLNDTAPLFTNNTNISVDENQLNLMTLTATDADNLQSISYSIGGDDAKYLKLDRTTGVLTFLVAPDFETKAKYNFTAIASDGKYSSSKDINVTINNLNEYAPTFTNSASISVDENQLSVMTLRATDRDLTNQFLFDLQGADAINFDINTTSGVITFKQKPDYEQKSSYTLSTVVSDLEKQSVKDLVVNINNLNDNAPEFYATSTLVDENQYEAMTLGVSDADNLGVSEITISGRDASLFDFDGSILRFKQKPDFETKAEYIIDATADDGENITTETITINIDDIPETELYIKKALYRDNATATVNDDKLYIYFNKTIEVSTTPADMSSAYNIYGAGKIGSDSTSEYNDTLFHQQTISLNSLGTASQAFIVGESNISLSYHTIADLSVSYPKDENITTIEKWTQRTLLKTGQNVSHTAYDDAYFKRGKSRVYSDIVEGSQKAVEESNTKLVWQKEDDGVVKDWNAAMSYCQELKYVSKSDWRLPTLEELVQLSDKSKSSPAINSTIFTNTKSSKYWSATNLVDNEEYMWVVDFKNGQDSWLHKSKYQFYVRCVRDKE